MKGKHASVAGTLVPVGEVEEEEMQQEAADLESNRNQQGTQHADSSTPSAEGDKHVAVQPLQGYCLF